MEVQVFIVPADPFHLPDERQRESARQFFLQICEYREDEFCRVHDEPYLIGHGEKSWIRCPKCDTELRQFTAEYEPTEHYTWWIDRDSLPGTSRVLMPCCNSEVTLMNLAFSDGDLYARFAIGAREPGGDTEHWNESLTALQPGAISQIESLMGCPVRQLWVYGT
jgi:hypothetical protein